MLHYEGRKFLLDIDRNMVTFQMKNPKQNFSMIGDFGKLFLN